MEIRLVEVDKLRPNEYNPNRMPTSRYEVLKGNIERDGMLQPILVNEDYTIIDGYHRWKACRELGIAEVYAVIVTDDEAHAKLKTLSMNKLRGKHHPVLFADLLKDLLEVDEITEEYLAKHTSLNISEIEDMLKYTELEDDFNFDDFFSEDEEEMVRIAELLGGSKLAPAVGEVIRDGIDILDELGFELQAYEIIYLYLRLYKEELSE